jgi:predicted amidophosphoribosyltransferase
MPLRAVCFSTYLTRLGGWRSDDYNVRDFIYALKDRDINKHSWLKVRGTWHKFDNANRQDVVGWFGMIVADYLTANPVEAPFMLVPVPGSKVDVKFAGTQRTAELAEAIAAEMDGAAIVLDTLRQKAPMPSANAQGGTRDAAELFEHLVLLDDVTDLPIVLVDDVLTSGGHLQACATILREAGADVLLAVVAARADASQVPDPFAVRIEDIADYER